MIALIVSVSLAAALIGFGWKLKGWWDSLHPPAPVYLLPRSARFHPSMTGSRRIYRPQRPALRLVPRVFDYESGEGA